VPLGRAASAQKRILRDLHSPAQAPATRKHRLPPDEPALLPAGLADAEEAGRRGLKATASRRLVRSRQASAAALAAVLLPWLAAAPAPAASSFSPPYLQSFSAVKSVNLPGRGIRVGYRVGGTGQPLVLIAGFGLTMAEWDPLLLERLAQSHTVYVFDNRGVATTTYGSGQLSLPRMADDTAAFIRALGLRGPAVLGWSMGGEISTELAVRHPGLVSRFVMAAADPGGPRATQPTARVVKVLTNPKATPAQLLPILFPPGKLSAGRAWYRRIGQQAGLQANSFTVSARTAAQQVLADGPRWYARGAGTLGRLNRIRIPVIVADGARDLVVPPANTLLLASRIPGSWRALFPDAGHAFLIQDSARFTALVDAFLA
jgi:pimeloyl-ACP methyl ester carboxylesterase